MEIAGKIFISIGVLFSLLGGLGILRMPDVFNRLQAGTKATTLGFLSICLGAGFYNPSWFPKLIVIMLFLVFTAPISSHNLARAAHKMKARKLIKGVDELDEMEEVSRDNV